MLLLLLLLPFVSASVNIGFYQSSTFYNGSTINSINPNRYNVIKYSFVNIDEKSFECVLGDRFLDAERIFPDDDPDVSFTKFLNPNYSKVFTSF